MNQKFIPLLKFGVMCLFLMFLGTTSLSAQRKVMGNVSDANGAIPGVSVVVKGTTVGTVTDVDGNFSLDVKSNDATLVISSVGYTSQEVAVGAESNLKITLIEDVSTLGEVVVSLTCFKCTPNSFCVAIIPYTFDNTNLKSLNPGDRVNIEFDIVGKYVERLMGKAK